MPTRSRFPAFSPRRAAGAATLLVLVAGCGGAGAGVETLPAAASSPVPPVTALAAPAPSSGAPVPLPRPTPTRNAAASGLPWPSPTAAGQADLQKAVDGGAQPWLLDPVEVAQSYAAFKGWRNVQAAGGPAQVTVRSSAGTHTLTLTQPGRRAEGGIWLVTGDSTG